MRETAVLIPPFHLAGSLAFPPAPPAGLVLFAHGSGSGRFSPRNRHVAAALRQGGMATLLFDLLSEDESERRDNVFDVELLAGRLMSAARWAQNQAEARALPLAYFGASTGAGAALLAAARQGDEIRAVVSRGGRLDLAGQDLPRVRAPTLLIVGGEDPEVLALNRAALGQLTCEKRLDVIAGASHLFEEPGALDEVVKRASGWFLAHWAASPVTQGV